MSLNILESFGRIGFVYIFFITLNQNRNTALERSEKKYYMGLGWSGGGGFNRFYVATTLAHSSAVVYIRHLFSPREGFLTHKCKKRVREKSRECHNHKLKSMPWEGSVL